jgi:hypothetical protein
MENYFIDFSTDNLKFEFSQSILLIFMIFSKTDDAYTGLYCCVSFPRSSAPSCCLAPSTPLSIAVS